MKTIKILLGIIAINLTLLTVIQTGIWPPKVQASETNIIQTAIRGSNNFAVESNGDLYVFESKLHAYNWVNYSSNIAPPKKRVLR